ncbi:MAG: heat-inducible transcriptional repressor HrcA [Leptolyngbyaceae cyanobacterium SL_1_1]|nr:heat-inducible transcriptional repressor HrcA [Leptolyngbyaceae cyanobacterium RM1_1_2]NJO11304.1 heat-inducible transcriptional repressor HrcA [Leptolyngbyaceae cyanobacterium SL_1_1]
MQIKLKLSARQQQVLWATIRRYVETAEPVGSKSLVNEYDLKVSPATIRNAMGFLEKSGLLYQPYTSAGRIPSDSGYRIYVNELIQPSEQLGRQTDRLLHTQLDWEGCSFEALLRGAAQILSTLSGYVTLITLPNANQAVLRHIQLVQVSPRQGLLIVMLDCYGPQSILIQLPEVVEQATGSSEQLDRELKILSNFLNTHLKGRSLSEVTLLDWNELDQKFQQYAQTLRQAVVSLSRHRQSPASTQIMISGLSEVLRQPEFSESHQIQAIVQLLEEEQKQIWPLIFETEMSQNTNPGVRIWIGSENPIEPMKSCALVSAMYRRDATPIGSVGILGPTRMMYENAIAVVEAASDYLSKAISQPA